LSALRGDIFGFFADGIEAITTAVSGSTDNKEKRKTEVVVVPSKQSFGASFYCGLTSASLYIVAGILAIVLTFRLLRNEFNNPTPVGQYQQVYYDDDDEIAVSAASSKILKPSNISLVSKGELLKSKSAVKSKTKLQPSDLSLASKRSNKSFGKSKTKL